MVGSTGSYGTNASDATSNGHLIKTDDLGELEWDLVYGGTGQDWFSSAAIADNGDYLIVGAADVVPTWDLMLMRLTPAGDLLWAKRIGTGPRAEYPQKILALGGDEFVILGSRVVDDGSVNGNVLVLKIDGQGEIQWTFECTAAGLLSGQDIIRSEDGSFLISGYQFHPVLPPPFTKTMLIRLDPNGSLVWGNIYAGGNGTSYGRAMIEAPENGFVLAGTSGGVNMEISRMNSDGQPQWRKGFHSGDGLSGGTLLRQADGAYVVNAAIEYAGSTQQANVLIKLDEEGNMVDHVFHGQTGGWAEPVDVVQNIDGSFNLVGAITPDMVGQDNELFRIAVADTGFVGPCFTYSDVIDTVALPPVTISHPITVLPAPSLSTIGLNWLPTTGGGANLLCSTVGLRDEPLADEHLVLFPNPADQLLYLRLRVLDIRVDRLELCDPTGRVLRAMPVAFDGSASDLALPIQDLLPGAYHVRLVSQEGTRIKAFVKL